MPGRSFVWHQGSRLSCPLAGDRSEALYRKDLDMPQDAKEIKVSNKILIKRPIADPYALLQLNKPHVDKLLAKPVSRPAPLFGNVESDDAPFLRCFGTLRLRAVSGQAHRDLVYAEELFSKRRNMPYLLIVQGDKPLRAQPAHYYISVLVEVLLAVAGGRRIIVGVGRRCEEARYFPIACTLAEKHRQD